MEDEKKVEFEEVEVVTDETENEVTENKPSKVKAWFSRHKVGLTRLAKGAALIGGGLVAGILIAHKKADNEEALELESGDWDPDFEYLPEAESKEDSDEEKNEEES